MYRLGIAWFILSATAVVGADADTDWAYPLTYKGKPAANVKVALVPYTYPTPGEPKPGEPVFATSDKKGDVRFAKPTGATFARFLARDTDGHGGYGSIFGANRYPPVIELRESAELTGRVTDADGKTIVGLKLKPDALGQDSASRLDRPFVVAHTPDWFWEKFPVKLAADGSFSLGGVPIEHSVAMKFEAPGYGSGRFWVMPGKPTTVALKKAGAIRLSFSAPPNAKPGDIRVTATRAAKPDPLEASADVTSKAGAALTLNDLPPGEYQLAFPYTGPAPHFPKTVGPVTVKPGETAEVTAALEPAARLTAKLVDTKTGKGVVGATLSASITRGPTDFVAITDAKANAEGKVELLVPAGQVQVTPGAAEGYAVLKFNRNQFNQSSTEPTPVAAGQTHDFGTFALAKTVTVDGVVVDEDDKPVAGATVAVGYSASNSGTVPQKTDDQGRFTIKGLNPEGGVVGVTARKGNQITAAPKAIDPGKPEGEIRVVVSEKYGARIRVRAVDRAGKPIEAVGIEMMHSVSYLSRSGAAAGFGTGGRVGTTTADGRFTSDVLQSGDRYTLSLSAPGYRAPALPDWIAKLGETRDFGDVVLSRSDLAVSGTVTDLAGKPIAGASVFDNADGPRPVETKTDAAGRFTLKGLNEGPAFVSVRAEGCRLVSVAATPDGPPVAIALRRLSDAPAPAPVISAEHKAATEKLTRHVLEAMWKNRVAAGDDGKSALRAMTRLDPATARKWRDEEKTRTDGKTDLTAELAAIERESALLKTAKEDADEAVALLKPMGGIEGFRAACELAGQLLNDSPDKALHIAEEAVARARGHGEAERAWTLAQAGELVWRAGKKDAGRKLIEEAAKLAEPIGFADLDGYRRGMVACRVALYDAAKCRAMIDPMKNASDFNRWLAQACPRLAEHDLTIAKKWLADFRPDNSFSKHIAPHLMAYRIARTNPDEAIAIARGIEDRTVRTTTLAGVAVRLKDKERAVKLIDAAVDEIVSNPVGYSNRGSGTAAIVLLRAKQIGHPDLASLRDKVLAARPPMFGGMRFNGPDVADAMALALTDPITARKLLDMRLSPGDLTNMDNLQNRQPLVAMALADPAATIPAVDELMKRVIQAKRGYDYTGFDALASVLSRPDRFAESVLRTGRFLGDFEEE